MFGGYVNAVAVRREQASHGRSEYDLALSFFAYPFGDKLLSQAWLCGIMKFPGNAMIFRYGH